MNTSRRLSKLGRGVFARNDQRKNIYRNAKTKLGMPNLVDLSLGSTDLLPPSSVLDEIARNLENPDSSAYCLHADTRPFREAVTSWVARRFDVEVDPDKEVLLLLGSQDGTAHLPLATMNSGDMGLIMDPSYPSHRGGLLLADAKIQYLKLNPENNWKPEFNSLRKSDLERMKMMVLGFPHNPTACVGEQIWLDEALALGVRHDFIVAHDNPYVDLALEGEAPALLRSDGWRKRGIEFFSFSKAWCMGGFRIAFAVGAEPLITALRDLKGVVDFNHSLAVQRGAIVALTHAANWPSQMIEVYRERRDRTMLALKKLGWDLPSPSMAIYLWLPVPLWARDRGVKDEDLAAGLLERTGVALTPGSGFGEGGLGWLRLALVRPVDELEEAVGRMKLWWQSES
ncbi:aminotransferase class I/II-fold pyridoxal phosphate-dependent enzyme [Prochlorococcus sp. MIT 1341]|uniref:aminotransferase class I/II-fold pyridoxal phosphate-dependent enzyme n=1 Tax=Prochlorococcus sp. MIT 1341 TaxID=3096221 RepID=UPI002A748E00|nr:aminotransferase class I/II-fold pyridoxal phosphate-dependent enzyme [Prochlorococcus sp. MIT 1341]